MHENTAMQERILALQALMDVFHLRARSASDAQPLRNLARACASLRTAAIEGAVTVEVLDVFVAFVTPHAKPWGAP